MEDTRRVRPDGVIEYTEYGQRYIMRPIQAAPEVTPPQIPDKGDPAYSDPIPVLSSTVEGAREAMRLSKQELRWNDTADSAEYRIEGGDWLPFTGPEYDDFMVRCSNVAAACKGGRYFPWHIPGVRMEQRIFNYIARETRVQGEGGNVYDAVADWIMEHPGVKVSLSEVKQGAKVLNRYESGARTPREVDKATKRALVDHGAEWKKGRRGTKPPRLLWHIPGNPKRLLLKP